MGSFLGFIFLLLIGYIFGKINETNHYSRLQQAERDLAHIVTTNLKFVPIDLEQDGAMVTGNVVVAVDYFKKIAAALKMLIGGRLRTYESLLERARREAIIRMKQEADYIGADAVYNVRLEFSAIGSQPQAIGGVELLAYGTAVKYK